MEAIFVMVGICVLCFTPLLLGYLAKEAAAWLRRWLDHRARMVALEYARREAQASARVALPEWVDVRDPASVELWRRAHVESSSVS